MFGLPTAVISIVCYSLCCMETFDDEVHSDDDSDDEERETIAQQIGLYTIKILKVGAPSFMSIIVLKLDSLVLVMHPKDVDGKTNNVNSDQTAPVDLL